MEISRNLTACWDSEAVSHPRRLGSNQPQWQHKDWLFHYYFVRVEKCTSEDHTQK